MNGTMQQDRMLRLTIGVWTILLAVCLIKSFVLPHKNSVYPIFAEGGDDWIRGEDMYDQAHLPPGAKFLYSPPVAAFLAPFARLPDSVGAPLWRVLNVMVFCLGFAWSAPRIVPGWARLAGVYKTLTWLALLPLCAGNFYNGQVNPLIIGLLLIGTAATVEKRWNLSAACFAAAFLFKVYPLALGLLVGILYSRQLMTRLVLWLALGLGSAFLFQQPAYVVAEYANWFGALRQDDRQTWDLSMAPRDVFVFSRLVGIDLPAGTRLLAQLGAALAAAGLVWWAKRRLSSVVAEFARIPMTVPSRRNSCEFRYGELLALTLAVGCSWMLLFGPATEAVTYVLIAPSLVISLAQAWSGPATRRRWWLNVVFACFLASNIANWFPEGKYLGLVLQPLAMLFYVGLLGYDFASNNRSVYAPMPHSSTFSALSAEM